MADPREVDSDHLIEQVLHARDAAYRDFRPWFVYFDPTGAQKVWCTASQETIPATAVLWAKFNRWNVDKAEAHARAMREKKEADDAEAHD